jgi:Tfp pilus assembly protein PilN
MLIAGFNLAAADYRRARRELLLAAAAVAVLVVLLLGQLAFWLVLRREGHVIGDRLTRMEQEIHRHQAEVQAVQAGVPAEALRRYAARVTAYNKILEAAAFSWIGLLVELERAVPPGITLHEIHPELATGRVLLRGTAQAFDDLTRLLRGLEQRQGFAEVFLLRQAERKPGSGGPAGLEFAVTLTVQGRGR